MSEGMGCGMAPSEKNEADPKMPPIPSRSQGSNLRTYTGISLLDSAWQVPPRNLVQHVHDQLDLVADLCA